MIKQEEVDPLQHEMPAQAYGTTARVPQEAITRDPFVLVTGASNTYGVVVDDRFAGLAGFGAAGLLIVFLALLLAPLFFRKGR